MVLHELVTGDYPFGEATPTELLERQLSEPLPDVSSLRSNVPADLDRVIKKATASHPADRYRDVETLIAAVEVLIGSQGTRTAPVAIEIRNPYKGLRAFQQTDTGDFFGREALTEQIVETLKQHRLVAVVGPSGSGKSSVVKAGVLPTLRSGSIAGSDTWFFSEMIPGTRPFEELEAALLRVAVNPPATLLEQLRTDDHGLLRAVKRILPEGDTELVLVIDQFEEIFSHVTDKQMRKQFLAGLRAAAVDVRSRLRIIITLRADFFDQPLLYPAFADLLKAGLVPVTPLSGDELERAIIEPGHQAGISFEPGLVGDIVSNVSDQPGALPLLQYALSELYERRDNGTLTSHEYTDIGGVAGALGTRAEELFAELDETGRAAARQVFLRLVTLGEGTGDTRRRVLREELTTLGTDENGVAMVLETFGESRLLSFDRDPLSRGSTVEVAHEALLTEWRRLREWIDSGRDDLRMHRSLAVTAEEWVADDRDPSFLLGGARLERIETWMETSGIDLAAREREYVDASISQRVAQEQASREQREREEALERRALSRRRPCGVPTCVDDRNQRRGVVGHRGGTRSSNAAGPGGRLGGATRPCPCPGPGSDRGRRRRYEHRSGCGAVTDGRPPRSRLSPSPRRADHGAGAGLMHWVLGKRRSHHTSAVEAARSTARATRLAAAVGLIGTLATVGVAIAAEVIDEEPIEVQICTAVAIQDYTYMYDSGEISHDEFESLRADAITDQLNDTGDC